MLVAETNRLTHFVVVQTQMMLDGPLVMMKQNHSAHCMVHCMKLVTAYTNRAVHAILTSNPQGMQMVSASTNRKVDFGRIKSVAHWRLVNGPSLIGPSISPKICKG